MNECAVTTHNVKCKQNLHFEILSWHTYMYLMQNAKKKKKKKKSFACRKQNVKISTICIDPADINMFTFCAGIPYDAKGKIKYMLSLAK